jgi:hypothetical protein
MNTYEEDLLEVRARLKKSEQFIRYGNLKARMLLTNYPNRKYTRSKAGEMLGFLNKLQGIFPSSKTKRHFVIQRQHLVQRLQFYVAT